MHIELWQSPPRIADQRWHWHVTSRGRIIAAPESFPTKQHAVRAAKAMVSAIIKRLHSSAFHPDPPDFELVQTDTERYKLTWR